jgi:hypothetical protein
MPNFKTLKLIFWMPVVESGVRNEPTRCRLTCGQVCTVPSDIGGNTLSFFGWSIAMVIVVAGGGALVVVVVVMVEDAWRAAHPSSPPAPRSPILTCHLLTVSPLPTLTTTLSNVSQHGNKFTRIIHQAAERLLLHFRRL